MDEANNLHDNLVQELRRGTIILSVLSRLSTPQYGYSLLRVLEDSGFTVEPGTLYPLLRRLEKQGLLDSSWDTSESRPRRYYHLSEEGEKIYHNLCVEWNKLIVNMAVLIKQGEE